MSSFSAEDLLGDIDRLAEAGEALAKEVDVFLADVGTAQELRAALETYRARVEQIGTADPVFRHGVSDGAE